MTSHVPDPLTPEERELAARLDRIGPHGEPSPALDARILGAAQAAAARKPGRPPRWPAWAGIAATLALALGAVWQLRPVQEVPVELEETSAPLVIRQPSETTAAAGDTPGAADLASGNAESEPQRPAKAIDSSPPPAAESRAAKVSPLEPPAHARRSRVPPPAVVFDDPSPVDVPAPPAAPAPSISTAPPPPPPAPPAPASIKPLAESTASDAQLADTATASATVTVSDLPVASDSQLSAVDWIERIRQRRDAGDLAGARASLALLQHDHPGLLLPDDVRAIVAPPPPDR